MFNICMIHIHIYIYDMIIDIYIYILANSTTEMIVGIINTKII